MILSQNHDMLQPHFMPSWHLICFYMFFLMSFAKFKKIMTKHIKCKRPHAPKTKKKQLQGNTHTQKQKTTPWGGWVLHSAHNELC